MKKMKNVIVSCMYRMPGTNLSAFCESAEIILSGIKSNKTMFIFGDFNIEAQLAQLYMGFLRSDE